VSLRHDLLMLGLTEAVNILYRDQADYEMRKEDLHNPLYHISPATNRNSILKLGLKPRIGKSLLRGHKYVPAIYAINCMSGEDPFDFFGSEDLRDSHDLWTIDIKGLDVTWWHDGNYPPDEQEYVLTTQPIPASHLRLVKKARMHKEV